jgi:hypothetical protein
MDPITETNESTYEITFRFKTMKEMNRFTIEYDRFRDEIDRKEAVQEQRREQRREQRSMDRHKLILRYKDNHPELSMSQCAAKIREWEV